MTRSIKMALLLVASVLALVACQHNATPQILTVDCQKKNTHGDVVKYNWETLTVRTSPGNDTVYATFVCREH